MKKMVLVFTLAAFALSGSAFAQDPVYFDNIGLYLTPDGYLNPGAEDGTGSCGTIGNVFEEFPVYVVLSRMTNPEVWFWECKIVPENLQNSGELLIGDALNAAQFEHEWIVGLASPLFANGGAVVLAELLYFTRDVSIPGYLTIEATFFNSLDGVPSYLANEGGPDFYEMHPALDGPHQLIMNGACDVVAVENSSWGTLKSLYR